MIKSKFLNKIISLLLSLVMLFSIISCIDFSVFAETDSGTCGDNVTWSLDTDTGTLTISGTGKMYSYSSSNSVPWYDQRSNVKFVDIKFGVTCIGDYAFYNCSSLVNITIPIDMTRIGYLAFYKCTNLTSIDIPNTVTTISQEAFKNCINITSITLPDSVTFIGNSAFYGCSSLVSILIPDSVTSIGYYAFKNCNSLVSITIPNGVTSIGTSAFENCSKLKQIDYYGCENEWIKINVGTSTDSDTTINYQYDKYVKSTDISATPTAHGAHVISTFCSYCDSMLKEESTVTHYEVSADVEATCTKNGLLGGTKCSVCNEIMTQGESISALGHSFTKYVSNNDATCTKDGTKTAKCDRCDVKDTIADKGTALGHSFTKYISNNDGTCIQAGTKTAKCDRCDITDTLPDTITTSHSFTKYVSDNNFTCIKDGTKTAKCDRCDETNTITDTGTALGHSFTKYLSDNNFTCTKDGTKTAKCDRCNVTDTIVDKGSAKHKYVVTNTVKATCTSQGSVTYTCTACSDIYIEIIPELEHNYKETVVKPTYTEKGYTKYVCSRCNDIYIDDKVDRLTLDFDKKYTGKLDNEEYGEVTYKIELPESGVLRINAESHNEAVGFYFTRDTNYLYSDNVQTSTKYNENLGYYVLRDEDFEDSKDTCIAALSGTVYLSVVKQTEANTNAEYSFSISYESSQESFSELNLAKYDNIPAAKAISLGSTYNGFAISKNDSTISGLESDEVDFYSISIPKGLPVVMKFQSDCKMRVEMYTRDAYVYNPFAPTSTDNDLSFSQEFYLYEGTQYIKIIASSTGKYKFSVSLLAPENLKVLNRKSNSVQLSWENMFGADGYQIQQYTSNGWMNTKSTTKTNYIISSLLPGRKYQFRVRQYVNINGKAYYSSWKNINASTLIDTSAYKISLSKTSYTYNGKAQKPSVTVKDSKGNKIAASNYTVTYASGRKNVGKYSVKITFKGNYSGSKTLYFTINPKATTLSSVTAKSKGFTVKWKKQATQTTGYEVQYATDSKFAKNKKTVTVSKNSTTSKTISKLKAKKKYYVRIRTYKTVKVNGKSTKLYSSWSKAKSVKTK